MNHLGPELRTQVGSLVEQHLCVAAVQPYSLPNE